MFYMKVKLVKFDLSFLSKISKCFPMPYITIYINSLSRECKAYNELVYGKALLKKEQSEINNVRLIYPVLGIPSSLVYPRSYCMWLFSSLAATTPLFYIYANIS